MNARLGEMSLLKGIDHTRFIYEKRGDFCTRTRHKKRPFFERMPLFVEAAQRHRHSFTRQNDLLAAPDMV